MCALEFEGVAARMVVAFKDGGELRLASMLAGMIAHAVDASGRCGLDALVPIPASPRARLRRGYDHVELIARPLAEHLRVPLLDVLELGDIADQRGLDRDRRYENMGEAFSLRRQEMVSRLSRVLLVDDVLTTGATLDAAADVLLSGGVDDVVAATACRVW